MTQEVQVIITLEVDVEKSKDDIKKYFYDCGNLEIISIDVKEEAEIYNLE